MADVVSHVPGQMHDENTPVVKHWCFSQVKMYKLSYEWTINHFSFCGEATGEVLTSSTFSAGDSNNSEWCIHLYPKGINERSKDYISLYLILMSGEADTSFKFSILNGEGEEAKARTSLTRRFTQGQETGYNMFLKVDEAKDFLPEDKLTIFCEMSVVTNRINVSGKRNVVQFKVPECQISNDLGALFDNKRSSDVTLVVGGQELHGHKDILAARSPVFAAMFEHEMQEKKRGQVDITDVDHEVLREMLHFIYTGRAPNLNKMAEDLLPAADKYALERLKVLCEEVISMKLSVENAADTLIFADLHSADQLKAQTIDFINTKHATHIMHTAGWKNMILSHPHLMVEAYCTLALQQQTPPIGPLCKQVD